LPTRVIGAAREREETDIGFLSVVGLREASWARKYISVWSKRIGISQKRESALLSKTRWLTMKCEKRDASGSQELVALSEGMLRLMLARRKFIEWALTAP
jgi:hypothetical protein